MEHLTFEQLPKAVVMILDKVDAVEKLLASDSKTTDADELMNIKQAAKYLKLEVATFHSKVSRRELPFNKRGKHLHFSSYWLRYRRGGSIRKQNKKMTSMKIFPQQSDKLGKSSFSNSNL